MHPCGYARFARFECACKKVQPLLRFFIKQHRSCFKEIQIKACLMDQYRVQVAEQLPALLKAFRKQSGLTQTQVAQRLGVTQQTLSALERNAQKVNAERLLHLLSILGVELVLRPKAMRPVDTDGPKASW